MDSNYSALGLAEGASIEEVKKAYRRLVKTCHPDIHPNDKKASARFNEITSAYDAILNPKPQVSETVERTIIDLSVSLTMRGSWTGARVEWNGYAIKIDRGFTEGETYTSYLPTGEQVNIAVGFEDHLGFTLEGPTYRDLLVNIKVDQKHINDRKAIHISNHPRPLPLSVVLPKNARNGDIAIFEGHGIPNHSGPAGDLRVKITIEQSKLKRYIARMFLNPLAHIANHLAFFIVLFLSIEFIGKLASWIFK